jgi:predicted ester cyclase
MGTLLKYEMGIDASVREVFNLLADVANEPIWHPDVVEVRRLGAGPLGPGSQWQARYRGLGQMVVRLEEYEPYERLAFSTTGPRMDMRLAFDFAPAGSTSRVAAQGELQPKGAMKLLSPLIGPMIRRTFAERPAQIALGIDHYRRNHMSDKQALVERLFDEVINAGRLEVADELFAVDYVDHGPLGETRGVEAFKEVVSMWRAAVPDVHCTIENWFESGDMAAWNVRVTGTHTGEMMGIPPTGRRFEYVTPNIGRLANGKAVEHWADQGMFQFLTQIGALEQPAAAAAS